MSRESFPFEECQSCVGPAWFDCASTWCRERRRALLLAAGVFQLAILAAMVTIHAAPLVVGETILLRVEPIDPRDLFRGDYMTLSYAISRVPPEGITGIPDARREPNYSGPRREPEERTVYVSLEPDADGRHWHATRFSTQRPATGKFIRGIYRSNSYGPGRLDYGIEAFYVPEGTGGKYEDATRRWHLAAEIALAPWGQAKLRGLRIE
jgi:uncharacterized membrane-anchored protein